MNAAAGDNPETATITEVTRAQAEQAAQPSPMSVGDGEGVRELRLASPIEGLTLR